MTCKAFIGVKRNEIITRLQRKKSGLIGHCFLGFRGIAILANFIKLYCCKMIAYEKVTQTRSVSFKRTFIVFLMFLANLSAKLQSAST